MATEVNKTTDATVLEQQPQQQQQPATQQILQLPPQQEQQQNGSADAANGTVKKPAKNQFAFFRDFNKVYKKNSRQMSAIGAGE